MFNGYGAQGAILQMLNHGIITGALFMMIGAIYERSHSREISKNMGLGKYLPAFVSLWGLFALASLGFPGTNGFVGEMLVFVAAFKRETAIGLIIVPGVLLSAAYMFRVSLKMIWGKPSSASAEANGGKQWKDLNRREWTYLILPAFLVIFIGLVPGPFLRMIDPSVNKLITDYEIRSVKPIIATLDAADVQRGLTNARKALDMLADPASAEHMAETILDKSGKTMTIAMKNSPADILMEEGER